MAAALQKRLMTDDNTNFDILVIAPAPATSWLNW